MTTGASIKNPNAFPMLVHPEDCSDVLVYPPLISCNAIQAWTTRLKYQVPCMPHFQIDIGRATPLNANGYRLAIVSAPLFHNPTALLYSHSNI